MRVAARPVRVTLAVALSTALAACAVHASRTGGAEAELLALEHQWVDAELRRDGRAVAALLDDQFVIMFDGRPPVDKQHFVQSVAGFTSTSQVLSEQVVHANGDTAVVTGLDTAEGTRADGQHWASTARYTTTYVRRHGRWLALAEDMSRVAPAAARP